MNTQNPSTADLLFRHGDLAAYVESRRQELAALQSRVAVLDQELLATIGQVRASIDELGAEQSASDALAQELAANRRELVALQARADAAFQQVLVAEAQTAQLTNASLVVEQIPEDSARVDQLKSEIAQLETEVAALEQAIVRTLETRRRLLLRQEEGVR